MVYSSVAAAATKTVIHCPLVRLCHSNEYHLVVILLHSANTILPLAWSNAVMLSRQLCARVEPSAGTKRTLIIPCRDLILIAHGVTYMTLASGKLACTNGVAGQSSIHHKQDSLSCLRKYRAYYPETIISLARHTFSGRLSCAFSRSADPYVRIALIAAHDDLIRSALCPRAVDVAVGRKSKSWLFELGHPESVSA